MELFKLIHMLAIIIWVGGMFFAYMVLRPSLPGLLKQPERLSLWNKVFSNFFKWVWISIFLLFASGLSMIYLLGGMAQLPRHIHLMLLLGSVMSLVFSYVFFACYPRYKLLLADNDWANADIVLAKVRKLIAFNLTLGLLTLCVAVAGSLMVR